jgi:hypothetical protein
LVKLKKSNFTSKTIKKITEARRSKRRALKSLKCLQDPPQFKNGKIIGISFLNDEFEGGEEGGRGTKQRKD